MTLISIIVPMYNVENYIEKCLTSLKNQTYQNFEVIVIDDGSTDLSRDIVASFLVNDSRFKYFFKDNGGLSSARNTGIKKALGEYICFVDSDDFVDEDYIEYMYNLLTKYGTKISACWHKLYLSSGTIKMIVDNDDTLLLNGQQAIKEILYNRRLDTTANAKLIHRDLLDDTFFPVGKNFEDIGSIYKLFLGGERVAIGNRPKYYYVMREGSITHEAFNEKKLDLLEMTDKMAHDSVEEYPRLEKAVVIRQVYARFSTLNQMLDDDLDPIYINHRNRIINYIKQNRMVVLKDKEASVRDKIAIILLMCGLGIYKKVWFLYLKRVKG